MAKRTKNPAAVALGRLGGKKGGWRRWWDRLTPEQRQAHQRKAAKARWKDAKALKTQEI